MSSAPRSPWLRWRMWWIAKYPELAILRVDIVPIAIAGLVFAASAAGLFTPVSRSNVPDHVAARALFAWMGFLSAAGWAALVARSSAKMGPLIRHRRLAVASVFICAAGLAAPAVVYDALVLPRVAALLDEHDLHRIAQECRDSSYGHFSLRLCPRDILNTYTPNDAPTPNALGRGLSTDAQEEALNRAIDAHEQTTWRRALEAARPRLSIAEMEGILYGHDRATSGDILLLVVPIFVALVLLAREEGVLSAAHILLSAAAGLSVGIMLSDIDWPTRGWIWFSVVLALPSVYALARFRIGRHVRAFRFALASILFLAPAARVCIDKTALLKGDTALIGFACSTLAVLFIHAWLAHTRQLPRA